MLGPFVAEFSQHLFADGGYAVEFGCLSNEFTHLPLICGGQCRAPVRQCH
jgi:hypothetical protein